MKMLSKTAKQVRSRLNIEDISFDPKIGTAIKLAKKPIPPRIQILFSWISLND